MILEAELINQTESNRLEQLKLLIDDDDYLYAAIQRLALVMSREITNISSKGGKYERKRRK